MRTKTLQRAVVLLPGMFFLAAGSEVQADVGPPVKIRMPIDTKQAVSGKPYDGVFEVDVRKAGTLSDFKLGGKGWTAVWLDIAARPMKMKAGVLRIPFRAIPTDADEVITLTLRYDGRRVTRSLAIGPATFARRGKDHPSVRVESVAQRTTPPSRPPVASDEKEGSGGASNLDGCLTLRFEGRIVYDRPTAIDGSCMNPTAYSEEGVDHIWVEVMDEDLDWDEAIWSGYTQPDGTFDTGWIPWDDCDIGCDAGCDTPDIYLRFECDTGVVNVQDGDDLLEPDWSWSNIANVIDDWEGSYHDFGTLKPANGSHMPALHMHNSITRAHRFLLSRGIADLPEVDVLWPYGDNAFYDYTEPEINISNVRQWNEGTHVHEYGHHFMYNEAYSSDPEYCNDWCDGETPCTSGTDCENPGHCAGCPENPNDAWTEGFPNWMADMIIRSWANDYQLSDGSPWVALTSCDRSQETPDTCCQDALMHNNSDALITETFVGALLRDMEDETQDDHDTDGIMDSLCLGFDEIFYITMLPSKPSSVEQFITSFMLLYPEHSEAFWKTSFNVAPIYMSTALYPPDTLDPAAVTWADSPTHPLGVGGTMSCVTVEWTPPDDEVSGACAYSWEWHTDPAQAIPDFTVDSDVDLSGCLPRVTIEHYDLGAYYFGVRARDCANHWGPEAVFGPFIIGECNNNGVLDLCEIACDASQLDLSDFCTTSPTVSFCNNVAGCGTAADCNGNIIPDDCDIASGTSEDCDYNGVPDECEDMYHWDGTSGSWHFDLNWREGTVPITNSNVCINVAGIQTVYYSENVTTIGDLSCHENLAIQGTTSPCTLAITEPSFVQGDLVLSNNDTVLQVDNRLDIKGLFTWTGSNVSGSAKLTGSGVTYANGGVLISEGVHLDQHHLILDGNSTSVSTNGGVGLTSPSVFEIKPGSSYEHQGSTGILSGWGGDTFVNGGTLIKSMDPGSSSIYAFTENSGLIHLQTGELRFLQGGSSSGDFLGDPGTTFEFYNGGQEFLPGSSIVADNVEFTAGGGSIVRGTYNVTTATTNESFVLTFADEAHIISYGSSFYIERWTVNFNANVGGTIHFDTLSVGPGLSAAGTANFNSGDPVQVTNLILGPGEIAGSSSITIDGLFTWNESGGFSGPGTVHANGEVLVNSGGGEKWIRDCVFNNAATATLLGGFNMRTSSTVFNNLATGVMDIQFDGGLGGLGTTFNNAGTIVKTSGTGTSTITAPTTNTGTVEVQNGVLEFYTYYSGYYVQTAGQTVLNGGDLSMFGPAPLQINGGLLTGIGTITGNVVNTGGTTAPGLPLGQLDVVGAYTQQAGAKLQIEIGGRATGQFDKTVCTGTASLAGTLEIVLTGGFQSQPGDHFDVLSAGSVVGTFDTVVGADLPGEDDFTVIYTPNAVILGICPLVAPDFNGDCDVDLEDHGVFQACLTGPAMGPPAGDCDKADFDGDTDVDLADFGLVQRCFSGPNVPTDPHCAD